MPSAADNKALVEQVYDAFFTGDLDRWFSYIDDRSALIEAESLPYGGAHRGTAAIRAAIDQILECWEDGRFDIEEIYASDMSAAAYGTMHWTARATGRRISFPLLERWTFEGGKVREVVPLYGDTALVLDALGID
ncbi:MULTISPECIES: nuclear transport factor 2 family protein [unclassified Sphingobium]|uniref:nuclear transport factor 2 family protein n=1 Tax=unclassified Sphingobium TaxID=2611147 RepID=UPI0035A6449B